MPLFDVTNPIQQLVNPTEAEAYEVLAKAHTIPRVSGPRFDKDIRTIDTAIKETKAKATKNNRLVFTKAGILVGHTSAVPHADVNHVWETAEMVYPSQLPNKRIDLHAAEMQLKFIGGLVRWRISLLPDTWLVYRRDSDKYNQFTGKLIRVSEYWIDDSFVPRMAPPRPKRSSGKATIADLKAKFGRAP